MTRPIQGINAVTMNDVLSALHGPILGPETAYAAITFKSSNADDSTATYHEFVQHAGAIRFADDAYTVATRLKQHDPVDIDLLVATVPLAVATERMHDTIRELAVNSHQRIRSVETRAILPLEIKLLNLRTADNTAARRTAWRALSDTIKSHHIIPFLEETHHFLHLAGDLSRKRRVILGARPDAGPETPHFQIVREFLHNISNGLSPFTTELQMLIEALNRLPADLPEADSFAKTIKDLTSHMEKWYNAYGSGILTLHRYFIFDGLEKTNRQMATFSIETLAQAAAAVSPAPLAHAKLSLPADNTRQHYVGPLQKQRDELRTLLENIAAWHDEFDRLSPDASCIASQGQLLIEQTRQAIVVLSKLIRSIPIGRTTERRLRQFYIDFGKFKAIAIEMALKFEGWNSRREAHMKLPY